MPPTQESSVPTFLTTTTDAAPALGSLPQRPFGLELHAVTLITDPATVEHGLTTLPSV